MDNLNQKKYTTIHGIFALLAFVIGNLYQRWVLFPDYDKSLFGIPLNWDNRMLYVVFFAVAVCIWSGAFLKLRGKLTKESVFFLSLTVIYSLRFVFYKADYDETITNLTLFVIHITTLFGICAANESVVKNIVPRGLYACFVAPFASFLTFFPSVGALFMGRFKMEKEKSVKLLEKVALIFLGVCVAVPVAGIIISLLSQDMFFSNFSGGILEFLRNIDIDFDLIEYINPITVLVTLFLFGALFSTGKPMPRPQESLKVLPILVIKTFMLVLILLYGVFFVSQIDGYICMLTGKIPAGVTYADFARSGFFALCAVACINGIILYVLNVFAADEKPKTIRFFSVLFTVITFLMLFTALIKMIMYIVAYGFTPKRFYTLWFMLLIAIIFSLFSFKLKGKEFNLSKYATYIICIMLLILLFTDFVSFSFTLNRVLGY